MTTWLRRLGSRLGSLAIEDPCPEYSSMDARDGLAGRGGATGHPVRRLTVVRAAPELRQTVRETH